nr:uncharacterized protein LOC117277882 [Nicotiana tomentosiformis]
MWEDALGSLRMNLPICYECGLRGHIHIDYPSFRQNAGRGAVQSASSAGTTSAAPPLARGNSQLVMHGAARDGAQVSGGPNRFYDMRGRRSSEASPDVVTGIMTAQSHDVTPYVAMELGIEPDEVCELLFLSTPVGHVVFSEGIKVDPQKIAAVKNFPQPTTLTEIHSFLGLAGRKSMGSLVHLEAHKRPIAKEVYRLASLGVRLADCTEGGVIVQHRSDSSLVVEVNEKQYDDPFMKMVGDPSLIVLVKAVKVSEELTYEEIPVSILDRQVRKMRNKEIVSVKVLWRNQQVEEANWEAKEDMKKQYPHLFV